MSNIRRTYSLSLIIALAIFCANSSAVLAVGGNKTDVEALIPYASMLFIYGYSAPNSIVSAEAIRTYGETTTDTKGFFSFNRLSVSSEAKELCFSTRDADRRVGFPLCIQVPRGSDQEIGPLLLSPTLSLSQNSFLENQKASAQGKTIPGSDVQISFFEVTNQEKKSLGLDIEKTFRLQAYATDLAPFATVADENGNFSFSIPTAKPLMYRFFVKSIYAKQPTPKSRTISYNIESIQSVLLRILLIILLFALAIAVASISLIYYEKKTGRVHRLAFIVIEMRLKPFGVRILLRLRRATYKLQALVRSYQKELFRRHR